ncbi:MAG: hypothetical protein ACI841_004455 [Planctomycetota bacterium]|jgi:hypothetical protein
MSQFLYAMGLFLSTLPLVLPAEAPAQEETVQADPAASLAEAGDAPALAVAEPAQDPPQEQTTEPFSAKQEKERPRITSGLGPRGSTTTLRASDGKLVQPGRIPDDTKADARELWDLVLRGTHSTPAETDPIESFKMAFELIARHEGGRNELTLELAYRMREGFLRTDVLSSNRTQLRGPDGDYLIEEGQVTDLAGRENQQSRRDMDQWISIARNFLSLTSPGAIRIVSMREAAAPTHRLPERVKATVSGLRWIEIVSPDFHLYTTSDRNKTPVFKALLGVREHTAQVELSLIQGVDRRSEADARLFVHENFKPLQGYSLPHRVYVYLVDIQDLGLAFFPRPSIDLWLLPQGQLNPELPLELFRP